jgi:hypothetical protein
VGLFLFGAGSGVVPAPYLWIFLSLLFFGSLYRMPIHSISFLHFGQVAGKSILLLLADNAHLKQT